MKNVASLMGVLLGALLASGTVHADGKATYAKCAPCHGADGKGKAAMKTAPFDLSKSDADLQKVIGAGKGVMPAYKGKLTDAEIADVVKHIRTLK